VCVCVCVCVCAMAPVAEVDEVHSDELRLPAAAATMLLPWPVPTPLEGVKSRKRAIFSLEAANVVVEGDVVSRISSVRLCLESRVVAVGAAGRALVEVLLGDRKLAGGRAQAHDGLRAVRLGASTAGCLDADGHFDEAAVVTALQCRPHVVVLEEGVESEAWASIFEHLLTCAEVISFRGAIVVCAHEETLAVRSLCTERWTGADGWLWQEQLAGDALEIWEDVLGALSTKCDKSIQPQEGMDDLLRECSEVAQHFFSEDSVAKARERGWVLSLLVEPLPAEPPRLCAFMCHRPPGHGRNDLHVARLAVPETARRGGYGQRLMHWILRKAANLPKSECAWVSLSSLDTAMPFYEKFGFIDMTCDDMEDPDHFQTWMELQNVSVVSEAEDTEDEEGWEDDEESS